MSNEEKIRIIENWNMVVLTKRSDSGGYYMNRHLKGLENHQPPLENYPMYPSYEDAIDKAYKQVYWFILNHMMNTDEVDKEYKPGGMYQNP